MRVGYDRNLRCEVELQSGNVAVAKVGTIGCSNLKPPLSTKGEIIIRDEETYAGCSCGLSKWRLLILNVSTLLRSRWFSALTSGSVKFVGSGKAVPSRDNVHQGAIIRSKDKPREQTRVEQAMEVEQIYATCHVLWNFLG